MIQKKVCYIQNWSDPDPTIRAIRDNVILRIATGVYYHRRLQLLIVVKSELSLDNALHLP